jgi:hypothetical protein
MEKLNHYFTVDMSHSKKTKIAIAGIDDYFRNTCPRNDRLNDLYEHIERKGLNIAWAEYISKDIEDLIMIEGPEFLLKHMSVSAKDKLIKYMKKRYL